MNGRLYLFHVCIFVVEHQDTELFSADRFSSVNLLRSAAISAGLKILASLAMKRILADCLTPSIIPGSVYESIALSGMLCCFHQKVVFVLNCVIIPTRLNSIAAFARLKRYISTRVRLDTLPPHILGRMG